LLTPPPLAICIAIIIKTKFKTMLTNKINRSDVVGDDDGSATMMVTIISMEIH
jgi:hypothetical protein